MNDTFYDGHDELYQTNKQTNKQTNIQFFYRPDALPVAQPTVSKHWREESGINIVFKILSPFVSGGPGQAGTRVSPFRILLELTDDGSGGDNDN